MHSLGVGFYYHHYHYHVYLLGFSLALHFGLGLVLDFLIFTYSDLSLVIWFLVPLSCLILSSVGEVSLGSGIVDLLYSSLSFKLML